MSAPHYTVPPVAPSVEPPSPVVDSSTPTPDVTPPPTTPPFAPDPVVGQPTTTTVTTTRATAGRSLAALRIATGLVFLWAFVDKTFGLGYATTWDRAWLNGGSPTKGFLGNVDVGPFQSVFRAWAGAGWANIAFMVGLGAVGLAVVLGIGLRLSALAGSVMMLLMWAAEWPLARHTSSGELTASTNPLIDYHIIYALALIAVAVALAGDTWGLGGWWSRIRLVRSLPWLR